MQKQLTVNSVKIITRTLIKQGRDRHIYTTHENEGKDRIREQYIYN